MMDKFSNPGKNKEKKTLNLFFTSISKILYQRFDFSNLFVKLVKRKKTKSKFIWLHETSKFKTYLSYTGADTRGATRPSHPP